MARELNRELFGQAALRETAPEEKPAQVVYAKADEVRKLNLQYEALTKRINDFESRVETMTTKVDDVVATNKQRFERVQGHFKNQNEQIKSGFADMNGKIAQVVSKVNERKVSEGMIKEMVERHSHLVQTFEVRMQQLQRIISEQELQLMNARNELKEALQELSRLKKL